MNLKTKQIEELKRLLYPNQLKIFIDIIGGYDAEIDNLKKALQKCEEECDSLYRGCSCEK